MKKGLEHITIAGLLLVLASFALINEADGAAYIKFEGVDGESQDAEHKSWSDLVAFSHSISRPSAESGSTRTSGAVFHDFTISKELDKSSIKLQESASTGKFFLKVDIHLTASTGEGRVTYYTYELTNVMVTSYSISGSGTSEQVPMEQISLNFDAIKVTYTEIGKDSGEKGKVEYSWNLVEGSK